MDADRLKLLLDFSKFFLGSVVVVLVTFFVNSGFKDREIAIKEQEYLAQFKDDALSEDIELRRRLAEYFSKVTVSRDARERWEAYLSLLNEKIKEANETESRIRHLETQIAEASSNTEEIATKQRELEAARRKAAELERQLRSTHEADSCRKFTVPTTARQIDYVIVTDTESPTLQSALQIMDCERSPEIKASYHYIIGVDGAVVSTVDESNIAWHAGRSEWQGRRQLNDVSIGIGLVHLSSGDGTNWADLPPGHPAVGPNYPDVQIEALIGLLTKIANRYDIEPQDMLTKQDVAPGRRRTDLHGDAMRRVRERVSQSLEQD